MTMEDMAEVQNAAAEPVVTEEATPAPEPEEDWRSKFTELESRYQKDRDTWRAQELGLLKQEQRDQFMKRMAESFEVLAGAIGDEEVSKKLTELNQQYSQAELTMQFQQAQKEAATEIAGLAKELELDPEQAAEFDNVRLYWDKARETGQDKWLDKAVAEAQRSARKVESERSKKALADAKKAADAARKAAFEESGILETATGGSAASTSEPSITDLVSMYARGDNLDKDKVARVHQYLKTGQ